AWGSGQALQSIEPVRSTLGAQYHSQYHQIPRAPRSIDRDVTDDGRRGLTRHGYLLEREIAPGVGPLKVRRPRVRDLVGEGCKRIRHNLLPKLISWSKFTDGIEINSQAQLADG